MKTSPRAGSVVLAGEFSRLTRVLRDEQLAWRVHETVEWDAGGLPVPCLLASTGRLARHIHAFPACWYLMPDDQLLAMIRTAAAAPVE
ncbi:MAG: hypothetical protein ACR2M1_11250 [Gemmatimonadaceae bacterium]